MLISDEELDKVMKELGEILQPKQINKIQSLMVSVFRQVEELRKSRDNWKSKYNKLTSS